MKSYLVTEYEMTDYENVKNNMSDSEAVEIMESIDRGYIPDYNYTGTETDFNYFKMHMAIQRGIAAIEKEMKNF